jgi:hypothetical protein
MADEMTDGNPSAVLAPGRWLVADPGERDDGLLWLAQRRSGLWRHLVHDFQPSYATFNDSERLRRDLTLTGQFRRAVGADIAPVRTEYNAERQEPPLLSKSVISVPLALASSPLGSPPAKRATGCRQSSCLGPS